ncbi:alpha-amylase family glycosyl hydrolase [Rhodanobacter ginsengiterrae]|uniref:alpha-amylase family glycosyl hydrolase n=1 Tax=Rhodanobacter ginsengiterrae TaxID=2008451 RepID=UPI003CF7F5F9
MRPAAFALLMCNALLVTGCAAPSARAPAEHHEAAVKALSSDAASTARPDVWYEIFVRSWYDTDGDGIGDLNGVTAKLDYLKALGVSGIWLMPINPSPSYHGYDITDYYGINPQYGTAGDFRRLLVEAHKRGIKVVIDLVINHTSDRHPWFIAARDPASPYHDWYSWAGPHTDLAAASAVGGQAWRAAGSAHYLGDFTGAMPDLNYDTPAVRREMLDVGRYWLKQGVDGFRLDAAQHIYYDFKAQDGDPQVLARNLAWWSQFRHAMQVIRPDVYIVGEVTQDSPDKLAPWFGPLSAVFDFPLASRLIDSARNERAGDLPALLARTDAAYRKATGKAGVDAPFLSNHDQERVMSQLDGNAQHMRMAAAMLLTLPGQPFVYYGEELGMRGVKPDPDLREPMRWARSEHASGETTWKPSTSHDGADVSVQAELADPDSLLARYRTLIHWREQIPALRDGALTAFASGNAQVVGWQLQDPKSRVLVLHNLSGQAQNVTLGDGAPTFSTIVRQTASGATLAGGQLTLPPYTSVILQ